MFEVMFSISIGALLFALITSVLLQCMMVVRTTKRQTSEALMLGDLSGRFREAVHLATTYSVNADSAQFTQSDGTLLSFQVVGESIDVTDRSNSKTGRAERYKFEKVKQYSLSVREMNGARFAELLMTGAEDLDGNRSEINILAAVEEAATQYDDKVTDAGRSPVRGPAR
jgi:hypothetical protein